MPEAATIVGYPQVLSAATQALAGYAGAERSGRPGWDRAADGGPAILSALVSEHDGGSVSPQAQAALAAWLTDVRSSCTHLGLCSWGLAGIVLGLRTAARVWPSLSPVTATLQSELVERACTRPWLPSEIGWVDYDLVSGPAGITLVLAGDPEGTKPGGRTAVDQMMDLCGRDDLAGLRLGQFRYENLRGWNYGRVNTGVAHGIGGVALALCAAMDAWGMMREDRGATLMRIARWLRSEAYCTEQGVITWHRGERRGNKLPPAAGGGQNAWCYGNPGLTWTLWEIGRVLSDHELQRFAENAFASYLAHSKKYDTWGLHGLNMCHGAAGEMMICDAFYRYAHLTVAQDRRDELEQFLLTHLRHLGQWSAQDAALLSGTSGVLAALLTVNGGDRRWLAAFGLR